MKISILACLLVAPAALAQPDQELDENTVREIWDSAKKGLVQSPTLVKSWLATLREARAINLAPGSKISAVQALKAYSMLVRLSDQKVVWDAASLVELGLKGAALANWVYGGAPIPYLAAISATLGAYKIPAVRTFVDESVFGSYLPGPENEYPLNDFTDPKLVNKPYLICNRYASEDDIKEGNRPVTWDYAASVDNPDLRPEYVHHDNLRRRNYIVVPGRWIKTKKSAFEYVIRFATTMNPLDLQLTCWNRMMSKVTVEDKAARTEMAIKTFELTIPHVGYSNMTQAYPIYFYAPVHDKEGNEEKRIAVRLVDENESKQAAMQVDKKDYLLDLITATNLTRMFSAPRRLEFINELDVFYEAYSKIQQMYNTGKVLRPQDMISLGLSTAISAEAVMKTADTLTNWHRLHKFAFVFFVLNAAYATASYAFTMPRALINSLGPVLEGPKKEYPLSEFTATLKSQTADLACRYYTDPDDEGNFKLLTWTWATKENGDYVPVSGRWIEDKSTDEAKVFFGTLDNYAKLLHYCMVESVPKILDRVQGKAISKIELAVGNAKLKTPYPLIFYVPAHNKDSEDTAVIFHPEKPAAKKE